MKKHPIFTAIVLLLVVAIIGCVVLHRKRVIHIPFLDTIIPQENEQQDLDTIIPQENEQQDLDTIIPQENEQQDIVTDDLQIHFLEVGNEYTGDCTLIKTGNVEVLVNMNETVEEMYKIQSVGTEEAYTAIEEDMQIIYKNFSL